jgi:DNA-binding NarL/FixJ family response regulator
VITAVLADDHTIIRQGLRTLLEDQDRCRIAGEASDGLKAIDLIVELRPDVAVLDVQMPDLDGLEVARRVQQRAPDTKVIMLSMHGDEPYVIEALRHGVCGYVLKGSATTDLIAAVHAAKEGRRFLSEPLNERAIEAYARQSELTERPLDRYELLTSRKRRYSSSAHRG